MGMRISPGQVIDGRYKIIDKLGEGGMGAVWKAVDNKHGDEVVIKMPLFENDPKILRRFKREAQQMRKHSVENPHILNIEDVGELEGIPWYAMRYLPGGSVGDRALTMDDDSKIQWNETSFQWLVQIASALDYLHQKGAFHRDVKPENILFSQTGTPYLVDFGIVKTANETASMVTEQGKAIGTMAYMPPEVLEGEKFTAQSDQYSLAVTLYEYLTSERPFSGTTFFTLFKSLQKGHRKLKDLSPVIPDAASLAVDRALSADASNRFDSCTDFCQAFLDGLDGPATLDEEVITAEIEVVEEDETRDLDLQAYRAAQDSQLDEKRRVSTPEEGVESTSADSPKKYVTPVKPKDQIQPRKPLTPEKPQHTSKVLLVALAIAGLLLLGAGVFAVSNLDLAGSSVAQLEEDEFQEDTALPERTSFMDEEEQRLESERLEQARLEQDLVERDRKQQLRLAEEARIEEEERLENKRLEKERIERAEEARQAEVAKNNAREKARKLRASTILDKTVLSKTPMLDPGNSSLPGLSGAQPAIVIALAPLKQQHDAIGQLMKAAGLEQMTLVVKEQINAFTDGIDTNKKSGLMIYMGDSEVNWLAMLPVTDLDDFLDAISIVADVDDNGEIFELTFQDADTVFLKGSGSYAYITQNKSTFLKIPSSPKRVLDSFPSQHLVSAKIFPSQFPAELRQIWMSSIQEGMESANEDGDQDISNSIRQLSSLINESEVAALGLFQDSQSKTLSLDFGIRGKLGSEISKWQRAMGSLPATHFNGFTSGRDALRLNYVDSPTALTKQIAIGLIEAAEKELTDDFELNYDFSIKEEQRLESAFSRVTEVFKSTVNSGTIDYAMMLSDDLNFAGGIRVNDPLKVETAFKDFVRVLDDSGEFGNFEFEFDFGTTSGTKLHRIAFDLPENEAELADLFGDSIELIVGIGDQSICLAFGQAPLPLLKQAIQDSRNPTRPVHNAQASFFLDSFLSRADSDPELLKALQEANVRGNVIFKSNMVQDGMTMRLELQYGMLKILSQLANESSDLDF